MIDKSSQTSRRSVQRTPFSHNPLASISFFVSFFSFYTQHFFSISIEHLLSVLFLAAILLRSTHKKFICKMRQRIDGISAHESSNGNRTLCLKGLAFISFRSCSSQWLSLQCAKRSMLNASNIAGPKCNW